ncbi:MAG: hypothetical protein ABUL72_01790, partial [Armatimonadota bacterium]
MKVTFGLAATVAGAVIGAAICADRMPEALDWVYKAARDNAARSAPPIDIDHGTVSPKKGTTVVPQTPTDITKIDPSATSENYYPARQPLGRIALAGFGAILGAAIGSALGRLLERWLGGWEKMPLGERVTIILGIFGGVLITIPSASIVQALVPAS